MIEGNVRAICEVLGAQVDADPEVLYSYTLEDNVQGWDEGQGPWPGGSCYGVEGQILYALVRHLKPFHVVQIGGFYGCSATHLALAIKNNRLGRLVSVDFDPNQCSHLWNELRGPVELVTANGLDWLDQQPDGSIDFLFEDTDHTVPTTRDLALKAFPKLSPNGIYIAHDSAHFRVGADVRLGLQQANVNFVNYSILPGRCGLAVALKETFHDQLAS